MGNPAQFAAPIEPYFYKRTFEYSIQVERFLTKANDGDCKAAFKYNGHVDTSKVECICENNFLSMLQKSSVK